MNAVVRASSLSATAGAAMQNAVLPVLGGLQTSFCPEKIVRLCGSAPQWKSEKKMLVSGPSIHSCTTISPTVDRRRRQSASHCARSRDGVQAFGLAEIDRLLVGRLDDDRKLQIAEFRQIAVVPEQGGSRHRRSFSSANC